MFTYCKFLKYLECANRLSIIVIGTVLYPNSSLSMGRIKNLFCDSLISSLIHADELTPLHILHLRLHTLLILNSKKYMSLTGLE